VAERSILKLVSFN